MIHRLHACIANVLLILLPLCHAMEKNPKQKTSLSACPAKIIFEIDVANLHHQTSPHTIQCLINDTILITHLRSCYLHDYTKQPATLIYQHYGNNMYTSVHPNKKFFAIYYKKNDTKKLLVYDVSNKKIIWKKTKIDWFNKPFFNHTNTNAICITHREKKTDLCSYNYIDATKTPLKLPLTMREDTNIATHPIKSEFALFPHNFDCIKILEHDNNNLITLKKTISSYTNNGTIMDGIYSPDGSIFVGNHTKSGVFTIDPNPLGSNAYSYLTNYQQANRFCSIAFHPTSFILAILIFPFKLPFEKVNTYIQYWNIKQKSLLTTTLFVFPSINDINLYFFEKGKKNLITFSYDGTILFMAADRKCLATGVPLEAQYLPNILQKYAIFSHYLINHMPKDIIGIIMNYLVRVHKYSLTIY